MKFLKPTKTIELEPFGEILISRNRRSLSFRISIKPDGKVRLTIPWMASFSSGENFLKQQIQWITDTKARLSQRPKAIRLIQEGDQFTTPNYKYHVCSSAVNAPRIRYAKDKGIVFFEFPIAEKIESAEMQQKLTELIENVLRFDAKKYLPGRIEELAKEYGYTYNKVTIKNNISNWGSCSTRQNINLNLHLMRLNTRLIDYVIVHELVHTVIKNHGPQFKATMQNYFPDIKELDAILKKTGTGIGSITKM